MAEKPVPRRVQPQLRFIVFAATIGIVIGVAAALVHRSRGSAAQPSPLRAQITWAAGAKPAPGLALRDQRGATISLHSLHGRVVLLTFLDSKCVRECPIEGHVLRDVLRGMRQTGADAVVVSVDPWADTPASARTFATRAGWSGNWHWLLGDKAALAPVWRSYNIAVKRTPGDILHSTALYLIDATGDLRAGYLFPFSAAAVTQDVRRLADGT
ncbi:MAG: SCO family protein [Actinobacteria bacterium]|nr:MAG: SCO family protein [Actinomycetota bacterium]